MIPSSDCQPWSSDQPGLRRKNADANASGYTTPRDTTLFVDIIRTAIKGNWLRLTLEIMIWNVAVVIAAVVYMTTPVMGLFGLAAAFHSI
jgi:hypothetical protein